jgi:hypothetical protein
MEKVRNARQFAARRPGQLHQPSVWPHQWLDESNPAYGLGRTNSCSGPQSAVEKLRELASSQYKRLRICLSSAASHFVNRVRQYESDNLPQG